MRKKLNLQNSISNAIANNRESLKDIGTILTNKEEAQASRPEAKVNKPSANKIELKEIKKNLKLSDSIKGSIEENKPSGEVPNILKEEKELEDLLFSDKELRKVASDNAEHFMSIHKVYLDVVFGDNYSIVYDKYGTEDCINSDAYYVNYYEYHRGITKEIEIKFPNLIKLERYLVDEWQNI